MNFLPLSQPAKVGIRLEVVRDFPRSAVVYAVRELARRAGVSQEFFRAWRIEDDAGFVNVYVKPGTSKRICFPQASPGFWKEIRTGLIRTSTATWMSDPGRWLRLVPNFKVPFSSTDREHVGSLFVCSSTDRIECSVDLLASIVLTLSRFEETLPGPRDEHGRFSAFSSVASRDGFLVRPIVDEYGAAFEQALSRLLPTWRPEPRRLRVKLGHDVDEIGLPFSFRHAMGHALRRHRPASTLRDLLAPITGIGTTYELFLRRLVRLSVERGLDSAVYWKATAPGPRDAGYDPSHPKLLSLIAELRAKGVEVGIHPGYETFNSPETLIREVSVLRRTLGERHLGGRQDFLRWRPETWVQWESLGLAYDASVGFADHIGFRAGTSIPFRPWLFAQGREAQLVEIPLLAMDATLTKYMKLEPQQALIKLRDLIDKCRAFGGVFTLLWHHTTLLRPEWEAAYRTLLDDLTGNDRYDWRQTEDVEWT